MTLEYLGRKRELECDHEGCKRTFGPFDSSRFMLATREAKELGWLIFKKDGEWKHYCCWLHTKPYGPNHTDEPIWIVEYLDDDKLYSRVVSGDGILPKEKHDEILRWFKVDPE